MKSHCRGNDRGREQESEGRGISDCISDDEKKMRNTVNIYSN